MASSRFPVAKAMTSCGPWTPFVYRGRPAEWLSAGWVKGAVKRSPRFTFKNLQRSPIAAHAGQFQSRYRAQILNPHQDGPKLTTTMSQMQSKGCTFLYYSEYR